MAKLRIVVAAALLLVAVCVAVAVATAKREPVLTAQVVKTWKGGDTLFVTVAVSNGMGHVCFLSAPDLQLLTDQWRSSFERNPPDYRDVCSPGAGKITYALKGFPKDSRLRLAIAGYKQRTRAGRLLSWLNQRLFGAETKPSRVIAIADFTAP